MHACIATTDGSKSALIYIYADLLPPVVATHPFIAIGSVLYAICTARIVNRGEVAVTPLLCHDDQANQ
jgi:hypothetical protein